MELRRLQAKPFFFTFYSRNQELVHQYFKSPNHASRGEHHIVQDGNSGFDLYLPHDVTLFPGEMKLIDHEIFGEGYFYHTSWCSRMMVWLDCLPKDSTRIFWGYDMRLRSSASARGLLLMNGVGTIDASYRGHLKACIKNVSIDTIVLQKFERIVQLVPPGHEPPVLENIYFAETEYQNTEKISKTTRGGDGFGSTGL